MLAVEPNDRNMPIKRNWTFIDNFKSESLKRKVQENQQCIRVPPEPYCIVGRKRPKIVITPKVDVQEISLESSVRSTLRKHKLSLNLEDKHYSNSQSRFQQKKEMISKLLSNALPESNNGSFETFARKKADSMNYSAIIEEQKATKGLYFRSPIKDKTVSKMITSPIKVFHEAVKMNWDGIYFYENKLKRPNIFERRIDLNSSQPAIAREVSSDSRRRLSRLIQQKPELNKSSEDSGKKPKEDQCIRHKKMESLGRIV